MLLSTQVVIWHETPLDEKYYIASTGTLAYLNGCILLGNCQHSQHLNGDSIDQLEYRSIRYSIVVMLHYRDRVLYRRAYTSVGYSIVAMLHYIDRVLYETALPCLHLTILILLLISYNRKHISCQCCWSIWTVARLGRVYLTAIPKVH